jgi:hypothetical protein
MTFQARVRNGRVVLDPPASLPEGAKLEIHVVDQPPTITPPKKRAALRNLKPIELPGDSLAEELIRDRR